MLFGKCTAVVLGSPHLLDRASLHLPRGISYFLLYLALESHNQLAVKKLVEKWPHGDLTLDFLAQSSLCRRHRCSGPHCLEPHEYMGVFGSYARYSSADILSSLLEGVFYNLYYYLEQVGSQNVGLRSLDMSAVVINPKQLPLLLNLVKGSIPVTHYSDYVSEREARILRVWRPHLQNILNREGETPLTLHVNVLLDHTTTKLTLSTLSKVCSLREWVEVKLKGINLLAMDPKVHPHLYQHLGTILSPTTDHVYLSDPSMLQRITPFVGSPSSLWLHSQAFCPIPVPLNCRDLLYVTSEPSDSIATTLTQLTIWPRNLRALCLMLFSRQVITEDLSKALDSLLERVFSSLEFLQLSRWGTLTGHNLGSLQRCSVLRVLSVSSNIQLPESLFSVVSSLPCLEYIHWHGGNSMLSPLLSLYNGLCDGFRSLCHLHFECFTSFDLDLADETFAVPGRTLPPTLVSLLEEESGDKTLSGEIVVEWLSSVRPDVCFKVWSMRVRAPELHQAVAMDIAMYNYSKYE